MQIYNKAGEMAASASVAKSGGNFQAYDGDGRQLAVLGATETGGATLILGDKRKRHRVGLWAEESGGMLGIYDKAD